ncbi:MAG: RNA methyltransferase [Bacteroidetes bacterium]|nr:RNA methyltransferase [Bacteroidota bacterium]
MEKLTMQELNRMTVEEFKSADKIPIVIVLDNIRSQNNIGSIFRTADSFRLQSIFLCGITATPPHREIHKTALGATETVDWQYYSDTIDALYHLKSQGFIIAAVEQTHKSILLPDFSPSAEVKLALIFGNEVNGVDEKVFNLCETILEIPQFGTKHSLNVSVAVGIVIWDIISRRNFSGRL